MNCLIVVTSKIIVNDLIKYNKMILEGMKKSIISYNFLLLSYMF